MSKTPEPNIAEQMLQVMEGMQHLLELAAGYKTSAMEAGFSEADAAEMAVCVHNELIRKSFRMTNS